MDSIPEDAITSAQTVLINLYYYGSDGINTRGFSANVRDTNDNTVGTCQLYGISGTTVTIQWTIPSGVSVHSLSRLNVHAFNMANEAPSSNFTNTGNTHIVWNHTRTVITNLTGKLISAGLPNVSGNFGEFQYSGIANNSAPFTYTANSTAKVGGTTAKNKGYVTMDLSSSNAIYGNSETVTPNSITTGYYIRY